MTRCKFRCTENRPTVPDGDTYLLTFEAVTSGSAENEQFFRYTPFGKLQFAVVKPATAARYEVGREYYLDLSPA